MILGLRQLDINGNPYVGVFCKTSEKMVLIPRLEAKQSRGILEEALAVKIVETTIGGSTILGSLVAMNSSGILLPDLAYQEEVETLREEVPVVVLDDTLNAFGNNILTSDVAAMVHPDYSIGTQKKIADALDVEVVTGTIAKSENVGSAAVVTPKGILCHPKVTEDEKKALEGLFKLEVALGTANFGIPLIGACVCANSRGAITGTTSTGIELGRIEDALDLI